MPKTDKNAYITNGLSWYGLQEIRLRTTKWGYRFIEIRLRPQLLINRHGYYKLTEICDFEMVNISFNYVLQDILSLLVPGFFAWKVNRVEAAIDIVVDEQLIPKYLMLFRKGNIPDYFLEHVQTKKYWNSTTNVYLMSSYRTVNWYNRYETLKNKEIQTGKQFIDFSETKGVLRFETQVRESQGLVIDVLNQHRMKKEVLKFYKLIVGKGHYYTLEKANFLIRQKVRDQTKCLALERMLSLINEYGSIYKAKECFILGKDVHAAADTFSKRINQLRKLGINPITLPAEWGIECLENLYDKIESDFG